MSVGRPVVLSNGALMVGLNEHGLVHDFFYPYVGLDNLTNARSVHHKIGVWVDGTFAWVDDSQWDISVDFETDAMVSVIEMQHHSLGIKLIFNDFVDPDHDAFCRSINVVNQSQQTRDIRLFMHQVFQISRAGRADTALYEPEEAYILDYKGRCLLLIYGQNHDGTPFDQYAIGNYGIEGKEGTFRDAEDGELSGNPVEHGGVDSVFRLSAQLEGGASGDFDYWIIAADSQDAAEKVHHKFKRQSLGGRLAHARAYWKEWMHTAATGLADVEPKYVNSVKKSLLIIKAHADKRGGILASGDSSIYNYGRDYYGYVWPRDAAFALWPLIRLGFTEEAKKFFDFCRDVKHPDGYMLHKYQPDRAIGSTWHPLLHNNHKELAIQEDETAAVVYMVGEYYRYTHDEVYVAQLFEDFVRPAANFMAGFIDVDTGLPHASYDLWEQKFQTSTYTTAITYQALLVAVHLATQLNKFEDTDRWKLAAATLLSNQHKLIGEDGSFINGLLLQPDGTIQYDATLDTSIMYGVMMFGYHNETIQPLISTVKRIEEQLLDQSPSGGLPRYPNDGYFASRPAYLGNPWFVCTLWLSQYYIRSKQPDRARHYVDWTLSHAYPSGVLSEQINPTDGSPLSVAPLVWSHAELINTILDLSAETAKQPE